MAKRSGNGNDSAAGKRPNNRDAADYQPSVHGLIFADPCNPDCRTSDRFTMTEAM